MPKPQVTAAERLVNEQMLAMIEWASEHPTKWHNIGEARGRKPIPRNSTSEA
jgi:hypothetical protein